MDRAEKLHKLSLKAQSILPKDGEAWLFGSQARGTANSESDWDVLILLDKDKIALDDYDSYAYPFIELGWDIDATVIPILYTKLNWEKSSFTPFYKNVMNDRIRL
ncbi:MAG: nucleotidyltransferase domain-containing protein [Bacteroidales bacterium]|nr:nucleotidyltransferase domain-containing protein [Bacteroidales bacterium]